MGGDRCIQWVRETGAFKDIGLGKAGCVGVLPIVGRGWVYLVGWQREPASVKPINFWGFAMDGPVWV